MTDTTAPARQSDLVERARAGLPGGVEGPVRAFRSIGRQPPAAMLDAELDRTVGAAPAAVPA